MILEIIVFPLPESISDNGVWHGEIINNVKG